jgi:hypothetical protein
MAGYFSVNWSLSFEFKAIDSVKTLRACGMPGAMVRQCYRWCLAAGGGSRSVAALIPICVFQAKADPKYTTRLTCLKGQQVDGRGRPQCQVQTVQTPVFPWLVQIL